MSIESLKSDYEAIKRILKQMDGLTTVADLVNYLKYNLVPFVGAQNRELEEQASDISDMIDNAQDILHEESAELLAAIIQGARALIADLEPRLGPGDDAQRQAIKEWGSLAEQGEELLEEITIPDPDVDADPDVPAPAEPSEGQTGGPS